KIDQGAPTQVGAPWFKAIPRKGNSATWHLFFRLGREGVNLRWHLRNALGRIEFLAWALLTVTASAQAPRQKDAPSRLRPAPQITGSLIDSDGKHRLSLQYHRNSIRELFTGAIQSTCMLPASKSGESKPLDLSVIPF